MKQINVGEDSWHFRLYKWWMEYSGTQKPPGHRENLCHYARVLVWAVLGWFFTVKVYKELRPWMIVVTAIAVAGAVYAIVVHPLAALFVAGLIVVILLLLGALFLLLFLASKLPNVVVNVLIALTIPVWGPIFLLLWALNVLWDKVIEPVWFNSHSWTVPVWTATVVWIIIVLRLILGPSAFTELVLMIVFAISVGTFVCFLIFMASRFYHWRKNRPVESVEKPKGISTPGLLYRISQAKVGSKICPYISLPHQWTDSQETIPAD